MKWAFLLSVVLATFPVQVAAQSKALPEGSLRKYSDPDSDDAVALLKQVQQEVYVNQQMQIEAGFRQQYGATVSLQVVQYASGHELIPGYVFTARTAPATERRPAILLVHGGFHERLNVDWFPLIVQLVERGYVVMFPEYRGSRGYGETIYKNDYGVTDVADVLAAAQYLSTKPDVDSDRLAIMGQSRGGMVTLLAIEQEPKRFRAAIDVVGLTDFLAYMAYKPEYRRRQVAEDNPSFKGKMPNENLAAYMKISPINAVDKIETPLLVLATTGDEIAPLQLHTGRLLDALKARGKTYDSKIYDNAPGGHVFLRGDTPECADATARIMQWLDKYDRP